MGPVVSREAKNRITALIASGAEQGARVVVDGRNVVVTGHEHGFFIGPTLIDRVTPTMAVYEEEIFGPVPSVVEAIELINSNLYGNGIFALATGSTQLTRRFIISQRQADPYMPAGHAS